jgi:hypothetical protein
MRCCRFWCWARRKRTADTESGLGYRKNAGPALESRQPSMLTYLRRFNEKRPVYFVIHLKPNLLTLPTRSPRSVQGSVNTNDLHC